MPGALLQCFTPSLYATLAECDADPRRCIAPTAQSVRCKWRIETHVVQEAARLRSRIEDLPLCSERHELLCEFVLHHCCPNQHRRKLSSDEEGCLDEVAESYGALIPYTAPVLITTNTQKMQLRSGKFVSRRKIDYFIPYVADPRDSLTSDLLRRPDSKYVHIAKGTIYIFTWPQYPQFVKIGFTCQAVSSRMNQWRLCHPGSVLEFSRSVSCPKRLEGLIHQQMANQRYNIGKCRVCFQSHQEWFQSSVDHAAAVVAKWADLNDRESLYDSAGDLTVAWRQRIHRSREEPTATYLWNMLDAEDVKIRKPGILQASIPEKHPISISTTPVLVVGTKPILQASTREEQTTSISTTPTLVTGKDLALQTTVSERTARSSSDPVIYESKTKPQSPPPTPEKRVVAPLPVSRYNDSGRKPTRTPDLATTRQKSTNLPNLHDRVAASKYQKWALSSLFHHRDEHGLKRRTARFDNLLSITITKIKCKLDGKKSSRSDHFLHVHNRVF